MIQAGQRADLVVLDANPLDDIRNIRRVRWTAIGGRLFDPNALWSIVDIQPVTRLTSKRSELGSLGYLNYQLDYTKR